MKKVYTLIMAVAFALNSQAQSSTMTVAEMVSSFAGSDSTLSEGLSSLGVSDFTVASLMQNSEFLESAIVSANNFLPMSVGEGVTATHVEADSVNITLSATYDESQLSVALIKSAPALFKNKVKAMAKQNTDSNVSMLLTLLGAVDRGVIFRITGLKSNDEAVVSFSSKELKALSKN